MTKREKLLTVSVSSIAVFLGAVRLVRSSGSEKGLLEFRLNQLQTEVTQARSLATALKEKKLEKSKPRNAPVSDGSVLLLKELTIPVESALLKIVSVEHPSQNDFRLVVEGEFQNLMRYVGYLEWNKGPFQIQKLDLARLLPTEKNQESFVKHIRGTFLLNRRVL